MAAEIVEVFETVVRDGIKYLVKKTVDGVGKKIKQFFRDENGDGVPDTEEPEFWEDDNEEISGGAGESGTDVPVDPFPETSDPVLPPAETSSPTYDIGHIVVLTPEGVVTMYADNNASNYAELVSLADERWLQRNGATTKDFSHYSVSEALLFIIAGCALFWLFCKIFNRRKL